MEVQEKDLKDAVDGEFTKETIAKMANRISRDSVVNSKREDSTEASEVDTNKQQLISSLNQKVASLKRELNE